MKYLKLYEGFRSDVKDLYKNYIKAKLEVDNMIDEYDNIVKKYLPILSEISTPLQDEFNDFKIDVINPDITKNALKSFKLDKIQSAQFAIRTTMDKNIDYGLLQAILTDFYSDIKFYKNELDFERISCSVFGLIGNRLIGKNGETLKGGESISNPTTINEIISTIKMYNDEYNVDKVKMNFLFFI